MLRPVSSLSLLLLAACGSADTPAESDGRSAEQERPVSDIAARSGGAERIECATAGAESFASDCTVERHPAAEGLTLTLRAPNGSFRRLLVTKDGRGVVAADGALPAKVTPIGPNRIDVEIAGDRYRLPATIRQ